MAFRFKKSESATQGVRRLCRERIRVARSFLQASGHPVAVYGVRKEIKKLRALLRLVRGEIGTSAFRKCTKALRAAAVCLAATRDARVMLLALEKIAGQNATRRFPEIQKVLQKNYRARTREFRGGNSVTMADRILKKTGRRLRGLKIKASSWAAIEPGLRQGYRRGREACRLARKEPSSEHLHEWRKHVKDLWFYFCLLSPAWPAAMRGRTDDLGLLGVQLGDDHDLFLLQQYVSDATEGPLKEAVAVTRLIETRRSQLRRDTLRLGSQLYTETPDVFCRQLEKHWKIWRKAG
ncbi:MAG TPA: CHAD domain-containing protein [Verrucomicrobiae bacterium]|nr:CHAD domain-containing protein [Verrucomicrobiae bacterium]